MKQVIIIPARYESSRLPGKPLVSIAGLSLIRRVWDKCVQAMPQDLVFVATDDDRIKAHCEKFGANVVMTSKTCLTGTDRIYEANKIINADSVINVQGDEPLVDPQDILKIANIHLENIEVIVNGMAPINNEADFFSVNVPKVVSSISGDLLYMSRAAIPSNKKKNFLGGHKQVCIYGFSKNHLNLFGTRTSKTPLEEKEDIEILRFLELGIGVQMIEVDGESIAVDVPEDVIRVEKALAELAQN